MTARTPAYLKGRYEQGDIPQGTDYEDVFDSYVNVVTSAEQSIDSNLRTTKQLIADSVSANSANFNTVSAGAVTLNTLSLQSIGVVSVSATTVSATSIFANDAVITSIRGTTVSAGTLFANTGKITTVSATSVYSDVVVASGLTLHTLDVSALATTQTSAVILGAPTSFVIFADGTDDSVKLPASERGRIQTVINAASTTIKIFPFTSGRFLGTAVNASLNIPADKMALVFHKGDDRYGIIIGGF